MSRSRVFSRDFKLSVLARMEAGENVSALSLSFQDSDVATDKLAPRPPFAIVRISANYGVLLLAVIYGTIFC